MSLGAELQAWGRSFEPGEELQIRGGVKLSVERFLSEYSKENQTLAVKPIKL